MHRISFGSSHSNLRMRRTQRIAYTVGPAQRMMSAVGPAAGTGCIMSLAAVCWIVSLAHYGAAAHPNESDQAAIFAWFKYCGIAAVLLGIFPILRRAIASLRRGVLDINTLMTIAVGGACAMQDFSEAAAVQSARSPLQ